MLGMHHRFLIGLLCASFLGVPVASCGAELKQETLKTWDAYIQTTNSRWIAASEVPFSGLTKRLTACNAFVPVKF
jgi:hypothetical protein